MLNREDKKDVKRVFGKKAATAVGNATNDARNKALHAKSGETFGLKVNKISPKGYDAYLAGKRKARISRTEANTEHKQIRREEPSNATTGAKKAKLKEMGERKERTWGPLEKAHGWN